MAIEDTLEELGYSVLEADNGREALAGLQEHAGSINLVLSDIVMPEMDGIVLQQKLE